MCGDRLAVYTTVYPGSEPFLADWYQSVARQTDRHFDLWVGLDGLTPAQVGAATGRPLLAHWVRARAGDTAADIRQRSFEALIPRYDAIVFVDSDDVLHPTRVASARESLASTDVSGCALRLADAHGKDLGVVFGVPGDADLRQLLPRRNVFGLSNSAYRTSVLERCLPVPSECVLVDWLLASRACAAGAILGFDDVPRMTYRRHPGNCVPVLPPFTTDQVLTASARVVRHYELLLDRGWRWGTAERQPFEAARARAEAFGRAIATCPPVLDRYVSALNELTPEYVWWWVVAHPALEDLWSACD